MKTHIGEKLEKWVNEETGEVRYVQEIDVKTTDHGFEKIWLGMILAMLDIVGGKKKDVVSYIISKRSKAENVIFATQRTISNETGVSINTVTSTIQALKKAGILSQVTPGCYRISPAVIWRGSHLSRMAVMAKFSEETAIETPEETKSRSAPTPSAPRLQKVDFEQATLPGVSLPQPEICEEIDPDSGEPCGGRLVPETREDGIWHVCERCGTGTKIHGSGCEYSQPSTPAA